MCFTITKASLAIALAKGTKNIENRHFKMKPGWYAIVLGVTAEMDTPAAEPGAVGLVYVAGTLPYSECTECESASDANGWNRCNVITDAIQFKASHKMKGAQGLRRLTDGDKAALAALCAAGEHTSNKQAITLLQQKADKLI